MLNHVGRPDVALAEAGRVLRPGGWLALSSWDAPRRNRVLGLVLDAVAAAEAPPPRGLPAGPTNFRSDEELKDLLRGAGFEDVGIGRLMFETTAPDTRRGCGGACWTPRSGSGRWSRSSRRTSRRGSGTRSRRLASVHRRPDGSLAIPVAVQVTRGRRP